MFEETRSKMEQAVVLLQKDLSSMRTSRATPSLIEDIFVEAYEGAGSLRIKELATISIEEGNIILIQPWDEKVIGKISQAIEKANIGLSLTVEGKIIRATVPPLSTERRQEYIKLMRRKIEGTKIIIRQVRAEKRSHIREQKEAGEISEDEGFNQEKKLQELTDEFVEKVDILGKNKEKDLEAI